MPDRSYPVDALGNELRRGDLVRCTLQSPALNFRVVQVDPAGTISTVDGGMPLRGTMVLVATMPVPFDAGGMLDGVFKLTDPNPDAWRDAAQGMSLVKQ